MSGYDVYVICTCGWFHRASFGDAWFTRKAHPVCPDCGRDTYEAETVTAKLVGPFWARRLKERP